MCGEALTGGAQTINSGQVTRVWRHANYQLGPDHTPPHLARMRSLRGATRSYWCTTAYLRPRVSHTSPSAQCVYMPELTGDEVFKIQRLQKAIRRYVEKIAREKGKRTKCRTVRAGNGKQVEGEDSGSDEKEKPKKKEKQGRRENESKEQPKC